MTVVGTRSTNIANQPALADSLLVNRNGSTGIQAFGDLAIQLAGDGAVADALSTVTDRINQIGAGGGGGALVRNTYASLVALCAELELGPDDDGRLCTVYLDPDPAKNGDYSWNGTGLDYLGLGRIGKLEAAAGAAVVIVGDNRPMVWDPEGFYGTAQTVYVPRRLFARIGTTVLNGVYGTESTELPGYVKLVLGDTDHSAIYVDLDDTANPVKLTNFPTEPSTTRPDKVKVIAEILGMLFKSDLPFVSLTNAKRDRIHFRRPLAVEGNKLLVPQFYHRRAGQAAVPYTPSGSHFWQLDISPDDTIYNHLIDIRAAQNGGTPVITVPGTGGPRFADDYLYVEFATSQNGGVNTAHEIRGKVPGGSVPNMFRRGKRPDLCRLYGPDASTRVASLVDVTDTTLLNLGFTKAVTGSGAFFGDTFEKLPPKKGFVFFRIFIRRASDGTWPGGPFLYLHRGSKFLSNFTGAIEEQLTADVRVQYTFGSYDYADSPTQWWMGGFQPTGTQDAQFTGAQLYIGPEMRGGILRDDWPDMLDDRLIIGPDLWLIDGRPLPIFLDSITGSRWASEVDRVLTVDSFDTAGQSAKPFISEGRQSVSLLASTLFDKLNLNVLDRVDRDQRPIASMNVHKAPATAAASKKVLHIGDSVSRHPIPTYVKEKLTVMGMTVTMLGTLLDELGTPTEGRSGWKWSDTSHDDTTYALPSSPATYLSFAQTGEGPTTRHDYNPWINPSNGLFDPTYYASTYSVAVPDMVPIGLGTNDERVTDITLSALQTQISTAFDKIVPKLLSSWASSKLGLWLPVRPYARDSDPIWQTFRRETVNLLIAKRNALVSGADRVDIIPVWAHMSPISGWHTITSPTPADGAKLTAVDDSLHPYGVNLHLAGEAIAAWCACKVAGV